MQKLLRWFDEKVLFLSTLFLLAFIPLYPKLPLVDIINTWVYVRAEDFVVVFVLLLWIILLLRRKLTLRTPLTMPILLFWIMGAVATIHGVLLVFPDLANVFPNVAFLSFLRRIEYLSLFFVAYSAMQGKRSLLAYVVTVLTATLLLVVFYGIGQKFLGFPAFLTMNEEYAKGIPVQLSRLSRVPSTFGGHYDLAAYLVLIIPIIVSMAFGIRRWLVRLALLGTSILGFILLLMTVSRVSVFALLLSLFVVVLFQKKKIILFSLPVLGILVFLLVSFSPSLLARFGNTIKELDVLVDAKTGDVIGNVTQIPSATIEDKVIKRRFFQSVGTIKALIADRKADIASASPSAIIPFDQLPPSILLVSPPNTSTGENLPQGTGYINLSLSPVIQTLGQFFYENPNPQFASESAEIFAFHGNFLIKRASAYDLSFTTRFQGEWPHAIEAFKRNILFGSGYGSISLAVDNDYLRMLGEVGLLGFASFIGIFLIVGIYIRGVLPKVDSPLVRSFVFGFIAAVLGLLFNAILIDVFEASKIAFLLWLLTGVTLGILHVYEAKHVDIYKEFKKAITSTYTVILGLGIVAILVFSPMLANYFVGDDFTWFRWAADCGSTIGATQHCPSGISAALRYFTQSDGFFYRPGAKIFFLLMYKIFWLNQTVYHIVSIFLHFITAVLVFFLAKKILRGSLFPSLSAFLFLILSGYSEAIFWTSSVGILFTAAFSLLSLLFFITWDEQKKPVYFIASVLSLMLGLMFHELAVVTPLLVLLYTLVSERSPAPTRIFNKFHGFLFLPLLPYLLMRFLAGSLWFSGDYSYNLFKLPFNIVGNLVGYFSLLLLGPASLPFYEKLRNFSKGYIPIALLVFMGLIAILILFYQKVIRNMDKEEKRIVIFGLVFFAIALLPFLGLGNIASRYSYLSSVGFTLLFAFLIKKLYGFLQSNGRDIAIAAACVVLTLFFLLHIIQLQQIHGDWSTAGERVKRFFIAIDGAYTSYWATQPIDLHFVNVPIRVGQAWVFPVGLSDAVWFAFRNPDIHVYQEQSIEQAMSAISASKNPTVFAFDENGGITEKKKMLDGPR